MKDWWSTDETSSASSWWRPVSTLKKMTTAEVRKHRDTNLVSPIPKCARPAPARSYLFERFFSVLSLQGNGCTCENVKRWHSPKLLTCRAALKCANPAGHGEFALLRGARVSVVGNAPACGCGTGQTPTPEKQPCHFVHVSGFY